MIERVEINIFDGNLKRALAILTASSCCSSKPKPVRRFVGCACKPIPLNEGLDQDDRMTVLLLPVGRKTTQHTAQNPARQVWNLYEGQDQKAGIVGQQVQIARPLFADPSR